VVILGAVFAYTNLSKEPWQRTMEQANNELTSGHNLDSAELLFRKAYQQAKESKQSAQVQEQILIQLSRTAADRSAPLESWQYASEALKLSRTHREDFQRASILDAITQSYLDSQTPNLAVPYAEEAVTVRKNTLQAPNNFITLSLQRLGQVYRGTGKLAQAEKVDREALAMAIQLNPDKGEARISDLYQQLSHVLKEQKKFSEAAENAQKGLEVSRAVRGEDHPFTRKLQQLLRDLKAAQDIEKQNNPPADR